MPSAKSAKKAEDISPLEPISAKAIRLRSHRQRYRKAQLIANLEAVCQGGFRQHRVFDDWIELCEATLQGIPTERVSQLKGEYPEESFTYFANALGFLVDLVNDTIRFGDEWVDFVGDIYMEWRSSKEHVGQYFTPIELARIVARIDIDPAATTRTVMRNITKAMEQSPLAQVGMLMLPMIQDEHERFAWFIVHVVVPVLNKVEPETVYDLTCGSGALLLAKAQAFEPWMVQMGLIRFYGQDLDHICVSMAHINCMLYGLGGQAARVLVAECIDMLAKSNIDLAIPEEFCEDREAP